MRVGSCGATGAEACDAPRAGGGVFRASANAGVAEAAAISDEASVAMPRSRHTRCHRSI